jgi:hypothetical protein
MPLIEVRCDIDKTKVTEIIEKRIATLGLSGHEVSSIIVAADDADYGACITRSKGFTSGKTHSKGGMGKTLPFLLADKSVSSDLVFRRLLFEELLKGRDASETYHLLDYIVSHELGHAFDYAARRVLQPKPLSDFGAPISTLASYWGPLLLSEFAASFIAGKSISADQYELIANNSVDCISAGMAALGTYKQQVYWNVLVEQAKIAGSSMGSPDLSAPKFKRWARIGNQIVSQLEAFVVELKSLHSSYPTWFEANTTVLLTSRCQALYDSMKAS